MTNIGVIGASGFVGRHLSRELVQRGYDVRAIVRSRGSAPEGTDELALGDFTGHPNWDEALEGLDVVICLAARVHVMKESADDPLAEFRRVNVQVTREIAEAAVRTGVSELVFLSSIKVNGEETLSGSPYRASDPPMPQDPYGVSKLEAEEVLRGIGSRSGLKFAVIRPPLVYGPGVGGNFLRILKLARSGLPLPLGSINNKRAMISVSNLADAVITASEADFGPWVVILVNDQESITTTHLFRSLASAMGVPSRLLPVPAGLLSRALTLAGKKAEATRLLGSLDVEISSDPAGFGWTPPYSTEESLKRTALWYLKSTGRSK